MKIAKKVLAVVMAIAMIAALSAMAFAAEGAYALTSTQEDGTIVVALSLKNGVGATSDTVTIKYDPAVLKIADPDLDIESGKDVEDLKNNVPETVNTLIAAPNAENAGEVIYGYAFSQSLDNEYLKAGRGKEVHIDPNDFEFIKIYFTVLNEDAETEITVTSANFGGTSLKVGSATEIVPSTEGTTDTANEDLPNTGNDDKPAGDNMALAAAAGVALLAGAAFVVSKKRK